MQHAIPDDLGQKLEHLAAGLNRDVDSLVREAIQTWVQQVEAQSDGLDTVPLVCRTISVRTKQPPHQSICRERIHALPKPCRPLRESRTHKAENVRASGFRCSADARRDRRRLPYLGLGSREQCRISLAGIRKRRTCDPADTDMRLSEHKNQSHSSRDRP